MSKMENWQLLPACSKEAEGLDIILACDGAASVGQVGHEVAVKLTKETNGARMCCITAIGAESKPHVRIAEEARKLVVINGCHNRCATKVLEKVGLKPSYEIVIGEEGVDKKPTLDFDEADVDRITKKIAEDVAKIPPCNKG